ncbi:MAG: hypothetical protein IJY73_00375 [Oscillospiraceae bacterium]|nr:hypothetical protein [Oscillospiraceae bacterium]
MTSTLQAAPSGGSVFYKKIINPAVEKRRGLIMLFLLKVKYQPLQYGIFTVFTYKIKNVDFLKKIQKKY